MPRANDPEQTRAIKALTLYREMLFTGRRLTLSDIHRKFGWPKQTILRVVDSIDQALGGVDSGLDERGRRWYKLETSDARPRAALTAEAIRQLQSCGDMVAHLLPEETHRSLNEAIAKTTVLLKEGEEREQAVVVTSGAIAKGYVDYSNHRETIGAITESISLKKVCKVGYQKLAGDDVVELVVAPLRLIAYHDALYMRCRYVWLDGKPKAEFSPRMLAVHRIKWLKPSKAGFIIDDENGSESFGFMRQETEKIRIRFTGWTVQYVRERIWSKDQVIEETGDGSIVLEFTATSKSEVLSWVMSFAPQAELLSPQEWRAEIVHMLKSAVGIHAAGH